MNLEIRLKEIKTHLEEKGLPSNQVSLVVANISSTYLSMKAELENSETGKYNTIELTSHGAIRIKKSEVGLAIDEARLMQEKEALQAFKPSALVAEIERLHKVTERAAKRGEKIKKETQEAVDDLFYTFSELSDRELEKIILQKYRIKQEAAKETFTILCVEMICALICILIPHSLEFFYWLAEIPPNILLLNTVGETAVVLAFLIVLAQALTLITTPIRRKNKITKRVHYMEQKILEIHKAVTESKLLDVSRLENSLEENDEETLYTTTDDVLANSQ